MLKIQGEKKNIRIFEDFKEKNKKDKAQSAEHCPARTSNAALRLRTQTALKIVTIRNRSLSKIDLPNRKTFEGRFQESAYKKCTKKLKLQSSKKRAISNCVLKIGFKIFTQGLNEAGNMKKDQQLFPKREITLFTKLAFKKRNSLISKQTKRENKDRKKCISEIEHIKICKAFTLQRQNEGKSSKQNFNIQRKSNGKKNGGGVLVELENITPWEIC